MILLYILHLWLGLLLHPFHVSVCELEFDAENESIEMSHRIFLDDLEIALRAFSGNEMLDVLNPEDQEAFDAMLSSYVLEHFELTANGEVLQLNYLGQEVEEDVMWCYVEATGVSDVSVLDVENKILIDTYEDQINIVHVKANGQLKSLKLYQYNEWGSISFDQ